MSKSWLLTFFDGSLFDVFFNGFEDVQRILRMVMPIDFFQEYLKRVSMHITSKANSRDGSKKEIPFLNVFKIFLLSIYISNTLFGLDFLFTQVR